jgi:hypothetical protein
VLGPILGVEQRPLRFPDPAHHVLGVARYLAPPVVLAGGPRLALGLDRGLDLLVVRGLTDSQQFVVIDEFVSHQFTSSFRICAVAA